jgi:Cu2+-exporting ATPase
MDSTAHASWSSDGLSHAVFAVEGMRCAACSRSVARAIEALPGVRRASVNVATGRAAVDWDSQALSLRRVLDAVAATGFVPVPLSGGAAAGLRRLERRAALKRIGLAGLGMMQTMMLIYCLYATGPGGIDPRIAQYLKLAALLIATPVLVYSGAPFFSGALSCLRRRATSMDVPVALALTLAYGASVINTFRGSGETYFDSVTMFIFFLLTGRFVEMSARQRNLSATEALARSLPARVTRIAPSGASERIAPDRIEPGDALLVPAGAVVPVDARLDADEALLDESLLTGESAAILRRRGEKVPGGAINVGQPVRVLAVTRAAQSMLASIVGLLERTQAQRAPMARSADRIASRFVVFTLGLAVLTALIWALIEPARALPAALAVLVVTCPCALSLATPAAIAAATGRLARQGLLVTRPDALERLARVNAVVVDKTGTLTRGTAEVQIVEVTQGWSSAQVLSIAAALENASEHPVAAAFRVHPTALVATGQKELPGRGVEGTIDGVRWRLGRRELVQELSAASDATTGTIPAGSGASAWAEADCTDLVLGSAQGIVARFALADALRPDAPEAVRRLKQMGIEVAIASGDQEGVVQEVARQLSIARAAGRLSPADKLLVVRQRQEAGERVLMVGDGINDGPVLAAASVSCAMAEGSAIAQAAADLLLLNESLGALAQGIRVARRMQVVVRQNLAWALAYNLAAVPLAALGWIAPWVAAIGMSASSLLVVLNASRLTGAGHSAGADRAAQALAGREIRNPAPQASLQAGSVPARRAAALGTHP